MVITVDLADVGGDELQLRITDDTEDHPHLAEAPLNEMGWAIFQDTAGRDITLPDEELGAMIRMIREFARRKGIPLGAAGAAQCPDLAQARLRIAALEQALETQRPALDDAHAKIAKYRLEIVGLLDKLAKVG